EIDASLERIKSIHPKTWKKIENWGRETSKVSHYQIDMANTLGNRIRSNRVISDIERKQGEEILNVVANENPELFFDMEEFFDEDENKKQEAEEITIDLVKKVVQWDKRNKRLKPYEYRFMSDLADGKKGMTSRNLYIAGLNLKKVQKYGFKD
ncbi:MAG: abortive phage resistance protein, partial [Bacteroidia bacterium]